MGINEIREYDDNDNKINLNNINLNLSFKKLMVKK